MLHILRRRLKLLGIAVLLLFVAYRMYLYYTSPYRVYLERFEDMPQMKIETHQKKHSVLLLHNGNINIDIKTFSESVKQYADKHNLDYYNSSQTSDVQLWQTIYTLFQKYKYSYIWVVPTNAYIKDRHKSIHKIIDQSGDTDFIFCRNESDALKINLSSFIFRRSEWTLYKLHQFYYKQQPVKPSEESPPLGTDILLDQVYTKYLHQTFPEFKEYLDTGIPYMLMNICVYNEHAMISSRSEFMRYYDRMPDQKSMGEGVSVFPWIPVKHSRFTQIEETGNSNIQSETKDRKIPKLIFQTMENNLTLLNIQSCITQIKTLNPDYKYYYFNSRECREFIAKEFPNIIEYYDMLLPGAYKADLWRYCVLYKYGGFYLDVRMYPYLPFDSIITNKTEFMSCVDITPNFLYQAILAASPKSECLRIAIDMCIDNIRNRKIPSSDLAVTGPGIIGPALNKMLKRPMDKDLNDIKDERVVMLQWNSNKAPKYLVNDKEIFCCHKYTKLLLDSEIEEETNYWLMLTGKEHYSILHRNNKIYKDRLFK